MTACKKCGFEDLPECPICRKTYKHDKVIHWAPNNEWAKCGARVDSEKSPHWSNGAGHLVTCIKCERWVQYEQYEEKIEEIQEKIRSLDSILSRTPAEELRLQQLKDRKDKYLRKLEKKNG